MLLKVDCTSSFYTDKPLIIQGDALLIWLVQTIVLPVLPALQHRLKLLASLEYLQCQHVLPAPPDAGVLIHSGDDQKTKVKHINQLQLTLLLSFHDSHRLNIFMVLALFPRLTLACLEMSRETMSGLPSCEARWRGVTPCSDSALAEAPYCNRLLATSTWFCLDAMWRAV